MSDTIPTSHDSAPAPGSGDNHERFCPECGTPRVGVEMFCAHCGRHFHEDRPASEETAGSSAEQPTAMQPAATVAGRHLPPPTTSPVAGPAGAAPVAGPAIITPSIPSAAAKPNRLPLIIGVAVGGAVLMIIAVASAVILLTSGDGGASSSAVSRADEPTWAELVADTVDDLDPERTALQDRIESQPPASTGAKAIGAATAEYRPVFATWNDDLSGIQDEADPSSDERRAMDDAIDAEEDLLTAITRISAAPSTANRNELERTATASSSAWSRVDEVTDGEVEVDPLGVSPLADWSLAREQARKDRLQDAAAARRMALAKARAKAAAEAKRRREAEAAAAAAAARAEQDSATGYMSCANLGSGGAGVINIEGTNVSCDEAYAIINAVPSSLPSTYSSGGFSCEMMDSDAQSWAYICQDGDRSFGFRIIDN